MTTNKTVETSLTLEEIINVIKENEIEKHIKEIKPKNIM
jgi:hypothetical protein